MIFTKIVIVLFILLELSNVFALYFAPGSKYANAVGVFTAWEKSKQDPDIHNFVRYLVYWVAGVKLIFLLLLAAIFLHSDLDIQSMSFIAMAVGTAAFFWRLFPLIRKMDKNRQIEPKNYSIVLGVMIFTFIAAFITAAVV